MIDQVISHYRIIDKLGAGDVAHIIRADALKFVERLEPEAYDIAFADPPYGGDDAPKLAALWLEKPFAKLLGIEHDSRVALPGDPDVRKYGTTAISFFRQDNL